MFLLTLMAVLMAVPVNSVAGSAVQRADSAYMQADFNTALQLYTEALDSVGPSSALYYNIGNSWYRTGHPGRAILNYERALRIDPTNVDARANLDFVDSTTVDRPGERGTIVSQTIRMLVLTMTPNAWAWCALALFVITLGAAALYLFSSSVTLRKVGFFSAVVMVFVTAFAVYLAFEAAARSRSHDEAVVVTPSAILSTVPRAPRNQAEEAMLLHEGTRVLIVDSINAGSGGQPEMWYDIEVDNEHRAWVNADDVERI